jgi:hypothetical protein
MPVVNAYRTDSDEAVLIAQLSPSGRRPVLFTLANVSLWPIAELPTGPTYQGFTLPLLMP